MNTTHPITEPSSLEPLRREMQAHYTPLRYDRIQNHAAFQARHQAIWAAMDAFAAAHPALPAVLLKARLHAEIAERFEPVIFPHSPFFFEMGLRPAENWGTPGDHSIGHWLLDRRRSLCYDTPECRNISAWHGFDGKSHLKLWGLGVFDSDHHCLGYTTLLKEGVNGVLGRLAARRKTAANSAEAAFLEAATQSNTALLRCAARFAERAEALLARETGPAARRHLSRLAAAARRVPAEPPRTFYEGLAALLFLREATATLEAVGISVLGHLDRVLIDLYRNDVREGRLTEADAADLLARWMLPTDVKFHVEDSPWPETSTCIEIGGCDAAGEPLYNELTRLVIETHHRHGFINPKLNCRYSARSPKAYLEQLGASVLAGHNNFAFINDDILIPATVRAGKTEAEARLYVNGGCQETMVEGYEHSAGAYYYFNMARVLDLCLQPPPPAPADLPAGIDLSPVPELIADAPDFAAFYDRFLASLRRLAEQGAAWARIPGARWPELHPCPLLSSSLQGCIEHGKDYTAGGAKYNPAGIALVGFGTVADSLFAIRKAVFDDRWCTLAELRRRLAANWAGAEALRARFIALPKFGHGDAGVDALAARFAKDIAGFCRTMPNERGGRFQPSFFVYYMFVVMGAHVRATPDGRRDCEYLSQGTSPGRVRPADSLTDVFRSLAGIDFRDYPGNAVLDVQLPLNGGGTPATLAAMLQTFARLGGATLQLNCVSVEQLREAQKHPERHQGLTVRISGLSARFVALTREVQDEIIARPLMQAGAASG